MHEAGNGWAGVRTAVFSPGHPQKDTNGSAKHVAACVTSLPWLLPPPPPKNDAKLGSLRRVPPAASVGGGGH
ncbi:unnamed protein product [Mesocestoides corti]|uniref:Uncharacterized protein n=1 Tax=Mesocestoides corti TaxID=53468 RepID=A0A0R3UM70_MESCO|nr:unnamed protein product [Mesocestoides corti]